MFNWFKPKPIEYRYTLKPMIDAGVRWYYCKVHYFVGGGAATLLEVTVKSDYFKDRAEAEKWLDDEESARETLEALGEDNDN